MKAIFLLTMLFLVQQVFIVLGFTNYETYLDLLVPPIFIFMWFMTVRAVSRPSLTFFFSLHFFTFLQS